MKMDISKLQVLHKNMIVLFEGGAFNDTLKHGSLELVIDTRWEKTKHVKDVAKAYKSGAKSIIPEGAKVWVNYLVASQDIDPIHQDDDGLYYKCREEDIYMYQEDGKEAKTVGTWVIAEPIEVDREIKRESGIILQNKEHKDEKWLKVLVTNDEAGVDVGDEIMVDQKHTYEFQFDGKRAMRVHSKISILMKRA